MTTITLVLPDLLPAGFTERGGQTIFSQVPKACPSLSRLLSKGKWTHSRETSHLESILQTTFGFEKGRDIPYGALGAHALDLGTGYWLRADPMTVQMGPKGVFARGNVELEYTPTEIESIVLAINHFLIEYQTKLHIGEKNEWYLQCDNDYDIATNAFFEIVGKEISQLLPSGPDQGFWHKWLTEIQMLLHSLPIHQVRNANQAVINALWIWGAGRLPETTLPFEGTLTSNERFVEGIAKCHEAEYFRLEGDFSHWFDQVTHHHDHHWILSLDLKQHWQLGNSDQWSQALRYWEDNWLAPMLDALVDNQIEAITIQSVNGISIRTEKTHLRAFWKKVKSLQALMQEVER